jgi:hypothetical protein
VAAWVVGVASEDAPKPKPSAQERTVDANALDGVSRTGGFKTAHVSKQRGQSPLIHTNQQDQESGQHRPGAVCVV